MANRIDGSLLFDTKIDNTGFSDGLKSLESAAKKAVAKLTAVFSLTAAVKSGVDFESAFAGVRKTVEATEEQLAGMRTEILGLANDIPLAATELAGIAESAGQLGIETENITDFTRTMADLGVSTNMTSEQAATSLARLANITQMPQENFGRLGSTVVALGNNLATTESEIVDMALRLAGTGKQVGMTEAQITSFSGALSSVGIESAAGGTAFSKLMADMQLATSTGNEDLANFAAVAGMSAQEFKQAFEQDAAQAIIAFIQGLSKAEENGTTAIEILDGMGITELRLRDTLLRAAGASDIFVKAIDIGNEAWEENTALTKEAEQRYDTVESKLQLMKNGLASLGIAVYDEIREPFKDAVETATEKISGLTESIQSGELHGAVECLGSLLGGVVDGAGKIASKALPILTNFVGFLGSHTSLLKAATAAVIAYKVAVLGLSVMKQATTAWKAAKVAVGIYTAAIQGATAAEVASVSASLLLKGAMKPLEVIVGVVTRKIELQTAATVALAAAKKLLTDHTGLLVAAGIALAAGLVTLIIQTRQQSEADKERAARLEELKSRTEELSEAAESQAEAYQSAVDSINQSASVKILELDRTKELADELTELADENGKVEDADKSRAAYILGELNKAMGTEYTMVGNQIQKYGDLKASIYDTIEAMQAKIVLSAYEEQLTETIKKQAEAQENAAGAADAIIQAEKDKAEIIKAYIEEQKDSILAAKTEAEAEEKLNNIINSTSKSRFKLIEQYRTCTNTIAENKKRMEESGAASQQVAELREKVSDSAMQIELKNYDAVLNGYQVSEEAKQAIASGSQDKILDQLRNTYDEIAALETQRDNASTENERAGWEQRIREVGESGKALLEALSGMGINADNAVAGIIAEAAKACGELPAEFKTSAEMSVEGIISYLTSEEAKKKVYEAAYALGLAEHAGYQDARGEASPAKEYIKSAKYTIDGIIKGLDDNEDKLMSRMEELADDELSAAMAGNHALLAAEREYLSESRRMERKKEEKEYQEKLAAAKTAEAVQKLKNERLEKLQEEADERYLERLKEAAEKEREILEERKNQLIDSFQEAADAAMDAIDDLADRQEDFYDKLSDSRELFRQKTITIKGAGEDGSDLQFTESYLTDLDAQNKALQEYADLLLKVRSRGELPDGFFDELRDMSIEDGTAFAASLLAADDETFAAYLASWQSIQDTSEKLSKEIFGEDAAELERKLTEEFGKLPEDFFDIGEESIQQFGDGFMGKLRELMQNVRREIQSSMSYLSPIAAVAGGGTVSTAGDSVTYYNTTYNLTASGSTVNEQLHAIRSEETRKKLAGL